LRVRKEIFGDSIGTEVGILKFRVFEVVPESDTLIAVHDDDVVLVEDEVVDPHWLRKFIFERSGCSPGGVPFAFDSDWVFVRDNQASWERSEISSPKRTSDTSDSCSLTTGSDDLITSSDVLSVLGCLEVGSWVNDSNLAFSTEAVPASTITIQIRTRTTSCILAISSTTTCTTTNLLNRSSPLAVVFLFGGFPV
jgi:hypothetical protein